MSPPKGRPLWGKQKLKNKINHPTQFLLQKLGGAKREGKNHGASNFAIRPAAFHET